MSSIKKLQEQLERFAVERDWNKFHTPKNLVMAICGEVGELADVFQWLGEKESKIENLDPKLKAKAKEEIADIFMYILRLADKLDIDLFEASASKLELNEQKYPVHLSKGSATKYNRR